MGEFTGGTSKVRCVDCNYLLGTRCSKKNNKVSPRKRRSCTIYDFKGEYINRVSPEALRVPYTDKSTQRLLRRMLKLGIIPVTETANQESIYKPILMPQSTATAGILSVKPQVEQGGGSPEEHGFGSSSPQTSDPEAPGVWKSEEKDESDSSGS